MTDQIESPIIRACRYVGGITSMASRIGVSTPTVSQWISGTRPIPSERCTQIERETDGTVTVEELRPDLVAHWEYLRGSRDAS